jgi:hypothetical protein
MQTGLVQGLLQQLQRQQLALPPDPAATAAAATSSGLGVRPSTSSSNGSTRMHRSTAAEAAGSYQHGSSSSPVPARSGLQAAAAQGDNSPARPASARPHSSSRPHTGSTRSSRTGTPQQQQRQQQHLQPPPPPRQQYTLLQASEVFQVGAGLLDPLLLHECITPVGGRVWSTTPYMAALLVKSLHGCTSALGTATSMCIGCLAVKRCGNGRIRPVCWGVRYARLFLPHSACCVSCRAGNAQ